MMLLSLGIAVAILTGVCCFDYGHSNYRIVPSILKLPTFFKKSNNSSSGGTDKEYRHLAVFILSSFLI